MQYSYDLTHSAPVTKDFIRMCDNIWLAGYIEVKEHRHKNIRDSRNATGHRDLLIPSIRKYNLVIKGTEWEQFENFIKALKTKNVLNYDDLTNAFFKTTKCKIINYNGVDNE
tara:strand:- start:238 stop:573 length:336 start_codon:yes stop_codon:yes gene_type:complete